MAAGAVQLAASPGQEGQVLVASAVGQEGQLQALAAPVQAASRQGQEGRGVAGTGLELGRAAVHGQEGQLVAKPCVFGGLAAGFQSAGSTSRLPPEAAALVAALAGKLPPRVAAGDLGAAQAGQDGVVAPDAIFTFKAPRTNLQGIRKKKWRRQEHTSSKCVEVVQDKGTGKKSSATADIRPTGSEMVFYFENVSMESDEFMLYGDVNVSCKRVCAGRVEVVRGVDGVVTHVSKELEEEEDYVE